MKHYTSNTYQLKRKILTFTNKISHTLAKPKRKFIADMTYGMLVSQSCLLTDIADCLQESSKKIHTVKRLAQHLSVGIQPESNIAYLKMIRKWLPQEPVILIDDSDVVKPDGYKFEAPGLVRDGSESTQIKTIYKKDSI